MKEGIWDAVTAREVTEPFRSLEKAEDRRPEVVGLERLGHESVRSAFVGPAPGFLLGVGGEDHHRDVLGGVVPANPVENLPAIHSGEADVEHDEVGRLGTDRVKPALTVVPRDDLEIGGPEADLDQPPNHSGILDYQDPCAHL